jgi:hypothetical protein
VELKVRVAASKPGTKKRMRTVTIQVQGVHFIEGFTHNLLSWERMRQLKWQLHSSPEGGTHLVTPGGDRIKLATDGNVTVLQASTETRHRVYSAEQVDLSGSVDELLQLHAKAGHIGFDRMVQIIKGGTTLHLGKLSVLPHVLAEARRRIQGCDACARGKGTRTAFGHRGLDRGSARCEVLHMDTFQVNVAPAGAPAVLEYGLVVVDGWTGLCVLRRAFAKDQVAHKVIAVVRLAQTQFSCKVKRLYADGGTEFINHTLRTF